MQRLISCPICGQKYYERDPPRCTHSGEEWAAHFREWERAQSEPEDNRTSRHADLCRLSRVFNVSADLSDPQDYRINEWLKSQIAKERSVNFVESF